jgi:hypothetical protein
MLLQLRFKISRKQNTGIAIYSKRMVFSLQRKLRQRKRQIMQNERQFSKRREQHLYEYLGIGLRMP